MGSIVSTTDPKKKTKRDTTIVAPEVESTDDSVDGIVFPKRVAAKDQENLVDKADASPSHDKKKKSPDDVLESQHTKKKKKKSKKKISASLMTQQHRRESVITINNEGRSDTKLIVKVVRTLLSHSFFE